MVGLKQKSKQLDEAESKQKKDLITGEKK